MYFEGTFVSKQISYDTALLPVGPNGVASLFGQVSQDSDKLGSGERAALWPEARIIRWLMTNTQTRNLLTEELAGTVAPRFGVEIDRKILTNAPGVPGDVDLILAGSTPVQTTAAEVKRVRVQLVADGNDERVVNLEKIDRGRSQSNGLLEIGFHQSWLVLVVVMDAKDAGWLNSPNAGPSGNALLEIRNVAVEVDLDGRVGVALVTVVQPSAKSIDFMANVGVCVLRPPVPQQQSGDLSERIERYFAATTQPAIGPSHDTGRVQT